MFDIDSKGVFDSDSKGVFDSDSIDVRFEYMIWTNDLIYVW